MNIFSREHYYLSAMTTIASRLFRQQPAFQRCFTCHRWSNQTSTRLISSTVLRNAALATKPSSRPTVVRFSPSTEYLQKEELDVDVLLPQDIKLIITDRAAQVM
jgi:iron-sulfur cluster assembly 2